MTASKFLPGKKIYDLMFCICQQFRNKSHELSKNVLNLKNYDTHFRYMLFFLSFRIVVHTVDLYIYKIFIYLYVGLYYNLKKYYVNLGNSAFNGGLLFPFVTHMLPRICRYYFVFNYLRVSLIFACECL